MSSLYVLETQCYILEVVCPQEFQRKKLLVIPHELSAHTDNVNDDSPLTLRRRVPDGHDSTSVFHYFLYSQCS